MPGGSTTRSCRRVLFVTDSGHTAITSALGLDRDETVTHGAQKIDLGCVLIVFEEPSYSPWLAPWSPWL